MGSTLSMMQRKSTKYQKFLNISNVFLLATATIIIFTAVILIKFYHTTKLDFWSTYFVIAPNLMIVLGVYTFLVCLFGFLISGSEQRVLLMIYSVLLAIAFLAQLASIFTAMEMRNNIVSKTLISADVTEELNQYNENPSITAKWDDMQRDLHCCGAHQYTNGYKSYLGVPSLNREKAVPDSCCHEPTEGCGKDIFRNINQAPQIIFVDGCLEILQTKLEDDVVPMCVTYACIGVLLAIVEIITVVLACAYVAQISRKLNREERMWRHTTADHNNDDVDHLRSTREDTMV